MSVASLLLDLRHKAGLTQAQLASRAGTSQPAIAAYESGGRAPLAPVLERIAAAAGFALTFDPLVDVLGQGVRRITRAVRADAEAEALRLAAELADALDRLGDSDAVHLAAAIGDEPDPVDPRWDALIAGVVERAARRHSVAIPPWTRDGGRFLRRWWWVTRHEPLMANALVHAPAELAVRGVLLDAASLTRV